MSSKKYASPLHLDIGASRFLTVLLFALHFFALIILWFLPLSVLWQVIISILVIASGSYTIRYHALKNLPSSITGLVWDTDDNWFLSSKQGKTFAVTLCGDSYIHPRFSILNFKPENQWFSKAVILLWDNLDENDFRRLRVRLKITNSVSG